MLKLPAENLFISAASLGPASGLPVAAALREALAGVLAPAEKPGDPSPPDLASTATASLPPRPCCLPWLACAFLTAVAMSPLLRLGRTGLRIGQHNKRAERWAVGGRRTKESPPALDPSFSPTTFQACPRLLYLRNVFFQLHFAFNIILC